MLPTQILLNNFLYDLAQLTIPTDSVDPSFVRKPQRWDIGVIRDFMLWHRPDQLAVRLPDLLRPARAVPRAEALFHTGWFVESLATQTLVLFVIRTAGNPFRSRPSGPLAITTVCGRAVAGVLPFTPLAAVRSASCRCRAASSRSCGGRRDLPRVRRDGRSAGCCAATPHSRPRIGETV